MKATIKVTGTAIVREHKDGGQIKLSTFIPLKIKKRGGSAVIVLPNGDVGAQPHVARHHDQPLQVALARAFYWQQLLDDGVVASGSDIAKREGLHHSTVNEQQPRCMSLLWFQRNPLPTDWIAQRLIVSGFDE